MRQTLQELALAFTSWRTQVFNLAVNAMQRQTHGTALGWVWVFARPAMYIFCFWFALNLGLRAARITDMDGITYLLWLSAGIVPWFYIQNMLNAGSRIFDKYSYLVNKLKFPVPLIPVFYQLGQLFIHLILLAVLIVGYFAAGGPLDLYALQIPLLVLLMFLFSLGWDLLVASLSAISNDVYNLVKSVSTPIFWLSGVIFPVATIVEKAPWIQWLFYLNPVTFLTSGYRQVLVNAEGFKCWLWDDPLCFAFGIGVIALTAIAGLFVYSKLRKEIPDVL